MVLTATEIDAMRKVELDILEHFVGVCEKLDLKYYLIAGTLLGAIRHKGFIPWDDDIDVGMPRRDYEVFIEKAQSLLPDYLFLQTHKTDKGYVRSFAKIRNSKTAFVETPVSHINMNHGMFIDIFPLDFCDEENKGKNYRSLSLALINFRISWSSKGIEYSLPQKVARIVSRLIYPTIDGALKSKERHYRRYKKGRLMANFSSAWGEKEAIPSIWYGEGTQVEFEGLRLRAPIEYDKWLTQVYGDYMQFPPSLSEFLTI